MRHPGQVAQFGWYASGQLVVLEKQDPKAIEAPQCRWYFPGKLIV